MTTICRTAFLKTVDATGGGSEADLRSRLAAKVGNTGNVLFEAALDRQLDASVQRIHAIADIPDGLELLVLSMSNFISPATDMGHLADAIERKRVERVVMVGCGAQSAGFDVPSLELKPGTRRFIDVLSERSHSIGVRGEYTANVLEKMGYRNLTIVGCPSVYFPREAGWPTFAEPLLTDKPEYGIHATPTGKYRDVMRSLFSYGMRHGMHYLMQTEIAYLSDVPNRDFDYYMGSRAEAKALAGYMRQRGRIFFQLKEWVDFCRELDFVLGSRFHGNLVAMLAGRPCLNMVFDSRTREMVEYFKLPFIHLDEFDAGKPVQHYVELADFRCFNALYRSKLAQYVEFLDSNGVPHIIGATYRNELPEILSPGYERAAASLVKDAIAAGMAMPEFRSLRDRILSTGRTQDIRDRVEVQAR